MPGRRIRSAGERKRADKTVVKHFRTENGSRQGHNLALFVVFDTSLVGSGNVHL